MHHYSNEITHYFNKYKLISKEIDYSLHSFYIKFKEERNYANHLMIISLTNSNVINQDKIIKKTEHILEIN